MFKSITLIATFLLLSTNAFAYTCDENLDMIKKINERALSKMMMGDYEKSLGIFKVAKDIVDDNPECADDLAKESKHINTMIKKLNILLGNTKTASAKECAPLVRHLKKVKAAALSKLMAGDSKSSLAYLEEAKELISDVPQCKKHTAKVSNEIDKLIQIVIKF